MSQIPKVDQKFASQREQQASSPPGCQSKLETGTAVRKGAGQFDRSGLFLLLTVTGEFSQLSHQQSRTVLGRKCCV